MTPLTAAQVAKVVPDSREQQIKRLAHAYDAIRFAPIPAIAEIWKATCKRLENEIGRGSTA